MILRPVHSTTILCNIISIMIQTPRQDYRLELLYLTRLQPLIRYPGKRNSRPLFTNSIWQHLYCLSYLEHLCLAFMDPLVKQEIGQFELLLLVVAAPQDDALNEVSPVRNALCQGIFFLENPVLFENDLLDFCQYLCVVVMSSF